MKAKIIAIAGEHAGRFCILAPTDKVSLGRGGIVLPFTDPGISRRHVTLELRPGGGLFVTDLGSTNGTYLQNTRLTPFVPTRTLSGDQLTIGDQVLRLELEGTDDGTKHGLLPTAARPGARLAPQAEDLEILGKIGEGSAGRVYVARERGQRLVALKVLFQRLSLDSPARKRFLQEFAVCQRIKSPHVIDLYRLDFAGDQPYLVMELIQGPSARELVEHAPLALADALRIGKEVALALSSAHAAQVLHRDVKPANILLSRQGGAKLGDFGVAKDLRSTQELTDSNHHIGSLPYLSPEQAIAGDHGVSTDIYGLGATLYHLLAGRPPFRASSPRVLFEIVGEPPPPLGQFCPDLPQAARDLVHAMLSKSASDRPPSAQDVVRELCSILSEHYPHASRGELIEKTKLLDTTRIWCLPGRLKDTEF